MIPRHPRFTRHYTLFPYPTVFRTYVDKNSDQDSQDFSGGALQGLVIDSDSYSDSTDFSGHVGSTLSLMDDAWVTNAYGNFTSNKSLGYSGSQYGSKS